MLTSKDIKNLIEAEKEIFVTKEEFKVLDKKIDKLQTSVDGFAKSGKTTEDGLLIQTHRVDKLEEWAKPIGEKMQMPLAQ